MFNTVFNTLTIVVVIKQYIGKTKTLFLRILHIQLLCFYQKKH